MADMTKTDGVWQMTIEPSQTVTLSTGGKYSDADIMVTATTGSDTKNTAGATDTSDKIYLVGAPTQTANPQTYTDDEVYVTDGVLNIKEAQIGDADTKVSYKCDSRTFTKRKHDGKGIYITANDAANGTYYFGSFRPDDPQAPARIKYEIYATVPTNANYTFYAEVEYLFTRYNAPLYHIKAQMNSTSYRPLYYISYNRVTQAGYTNGYGHLLGFNMQSATNPTNASYLRQIKVNILEVEGGSWSWIDTDTVYKETDISYFNTTNYAGRTSIDTSSTRSVGTSISLTNTYDKTAMANNMLENGNFRCHNYAIFGFDRDGKMQAISRVGTAASTALVATDAATKRVYNSNGFDYTKGFAYIGNTLFAENAKTGNTASIYPITSGIDFRYTDNCLNDNTTTANPDISLQPTKPVYLRCYVKGDGLLYLAPDTVTYNNKNYEKCWSQTIPNEREYYETTPYTKYPVVYWFLGYPKYNGDTNYQTNYFQINLWPVHPVYAYDGNSVVECTSDMLATFGGIVRGPLTVQQRCTLESGAIVIGDLDGGAETAGYVEIIRFSFLDVKMDTPISLTVEQKGGRRGRIEFCLNDAMYVPNLHLSYIYCTDTLNDIYYKTTLFDTPSNVYSLQIFVKKTSTTDNISIIDIAIPSALTRTKMYWTYPNNLITSVSDCTQVINKGNTIYANDLALTASTLTNISSSILSYSYSKNSHEAELFIRTTGALSNGSVLAITDKPKVRYVITPVFNYDNGKTINGSLWIEQSSGKIYYYGDAVSVSIGAYVKYELQ